MQVAKLLAAAATATAVTESSARCQQPHQQPLVEGSMDCAVDLTAHHIAAVLGDLVIKLEN
jgi:hypothetical protein